MKYFAMVALLASASAIQLRDSDEERQLMNDEMEVHQKITTEKLQKDLKQLEDEDKDLITAYQGKLDQTKRNVEQGEMGRSLAIGKIVDMKQSFTQLGNHIAEEGKIIKQEIELDKEKKKANPTRSANEVD